jgi:hypothetical protein
MVKGIQWFFGLLLILLSGCGGPQSVLINPSQTPTKQVLVTSTTPHVTTTATITLNSTSVSTPTLVPTATFDFSNYRLTWIRFSAPVYKVSFEYPSIYSEAPYQEECAPYDGYDGVGISSHSEIMVRSQDGLQLSDFIPVFIDKYWSARPVEIIANTASQAGPYPARQVDYQFIGTDITSTFTFVSHDEIAYIFSFSSETSCDLAELNLQEWYAYQRAIETFKILR